MAAGPDIFVACGDYGFRKWRPEEVAADVAAFEAPVRVAVLGNHDYSRGEAGAVKLRRELELRGVVVLKNQAAVFDIRGSEIWIGGLDDGASGRAIPRAMLDCVTVGGESPHVEILLSHSPDAVQRMPIGSFDLAMSGHTHGGQISLPFVNPTLLRKWARTSFDRGFYGVQGGTLFVTKGLGTVGYHARFRSRPEVVLLHLRSRSGSEGPREQTSRSDELTSRMAHVAAR
jgi:predicted MPP superfamily phosphohydrolase